MNQLVKIIIVIAIIGSAFYVGRYSASNKFSLENNSLGLNAESEVDKVASPQRLLPENMILGQVTEINNQNITIKLADGTIKTILLSGTTRIGKVVTGTLSDIVVGSPLAVNGSQNSDGSVSAQMVQIRQQAPVGQKPPRRQGNN